jgi:hypothetical protein
MTTTPTADGDNDAVDTGTDTEIDISQPHSARVYDWWLGGTDNYPADAMLGELFIREIPAMRLMARANRDFMLRAGRFLAAEARISQFVDVGAGIPTSPNLHEAVQAVEPAARIVYIDNDPIVLRQSRGRMAGTAAGATAYIEADLRRPEDLLNHPGLRAAVDLGQPVALMLIAVLMLLPDSDDPWALTRTLLDALPSGSHVAISHPGLEFDPEAVATVSALAAAGNITLVPRTREEVERFFGDWELLAPGVTPVLGWRPDAPTDDQEAAFYWAGVARKP